MKSINPRRIILTVGMAVLLAIPVAQAGTVVTAFSSATPAGLGCSVWGFAGRKQVTSC
ncbi:MAG: hypothetical protein ACKVY0_09155 [Prosthecobacter sp.]|uniref:hypothetical protein n=1 Tax=Prosthecobacter sp. TaxID=1965333 RepID=UPI00390001C5